MAIGYWLRLRTHKLSNKLQAPIKLAPKALSCTVKSSSFNSASPKSLIYVPFRQTKWQSYLQKSMEPWLLFLTPNDGLLAHFKKVDKRWVGLHQLFRLEKREDTSQALRNGTIQILHWRACFISYYFWISLIKKKFCAIILACIFVKESQILILTLYALLL